MADAFSEGTVLRHKAVPKKQDITRGLLESNWLVVHRLPGRLIPTTMYTDRPFPEGLFVAPLGATVRLGLFAAA